MWYGVGSVGASCGSWSLRRLSNEWTDAIGDKDFLGGTAPNVADLTVYGVLQAVRGTDTFTELMEVSANVLGAILERQWVLRSRGSRHVTGPAGDKDQAMVHADGQGHAQEHGQADQSVGCLSMPFCYSSFNHWTFRISN